MTKVEIFNHDGRIHGFSVSGHSGYAEEGSDIVCAAVSAAVTFAECTINDVLGNHANTKVKEEEPGSPSPFPQPATTKTPCRPC